MTGWMGRCLMATPGVTSAPSLRCACHEDLGESRSLMQCPGMLLFLAYLSLQFRLFRVIQPALLLVGKCFTFRQTC